jgi:hypothetical protein
VSGIITFETELGPWPGVWEGTGRGEAAKGSVRSVGGLEVLEAVEDGVDIIDVPGQVVDRIELIAPSAVAAFDRAVHLRTFGRKHIEANGLVLAGSLELGHELRSAVDLDGLDLERHVAHELVEEDCSRSRGGAVEDLGHRPLGDRIVGGEVFDGFRAPRKMATSVESCESNLWFHDLRTWGWDSWAFLTRTNIASILSL